MHDVRAIFDAMDQNLFVAIYVTSLFLFTVWIGCRVIQLAWSYAEPHVYLWLNFRKESEREVSSEMLPASSRMAATALRTTVRRDVRQRFRARLQERGNQATVTATSFTLGTISFPADQFNHDERGDWPIARDAADRQSQGFMTPKGAA